MLNAAVFIPMPKRPIPCLFPNVVDPPNDVATFRTVGDIPLPLSYTAISISYSPLFPRWQKKTRTSVAPACIALSTCSQSAEVVWLYPTSRRERIIVWPKKSGTVAFSFRMRFITALPPRGESSPQSSIGTSGASAGTCSIVMTILLPCEVRCGPPGKVIHQKGFETARLLQGYTHRWTSSAPHAHVLHRFDGEIGNQSRGRHLQSL